MSKLTINGQPATQQEIMLVLETVNTKIREIKAQGACIPEIPYTTENLSAETIYRYLDEDKNGTIEFDDISDTNILYLKIFDDVATILVQHGIKAKTTTEDCCEQEESHISKKLVDLDPAVGFLSVGKLDLDSDGRPDVELQAIQNPDHENSLDVYASVLPESNLAKSHGSIAVKIGPSFGVSDIFQKIQDEYHTRPRKDLVFSGGELHVNQLGFGDCQFLSALLTISPNTLIQKVQENADGSYRVTIGNKSAIIDPSDMEEITKAHVSKYHIPFLNSWSFTGKMIQIMEAALYKHPSLFGMNEHRKHPMEIPSGPSTIESLTGKTIQTYRIKEVKKYLRAFFEGTYTTSTPIVLGGGPYFSNKGHAYAVVGYHDGKILYKNPWYSGFIFEVAIEDLEDKFSSIDLPDGLITDVIANQDPVEAEAARTSKQP